MVKYFVAYWFYRIIKNKSCVSVLRKGENMGKKLKITLSTLCFVLCFSLCAFAAIEKPRNPEPKKVIYSNTLPLVQAEYDDNEGKTLVREYILGDKASSSDPKGTLGVVSVKGAYYHVKGVRQFNTKDKSEFWRNAKTGNWCTKGSFDMPDGKPAPGELVHFVIETGMGEGTTYFSDLVTFVVPAEGETLEVKYQKNLIPVAVPKGKEFTYDGKSHQGVDDNKGYKIGATASAVNAGTYTTRLSVNDGYKWEDGSTQDKKVTWKINKAKIDEVKFASTVLTYFGGVQSPVVISVKANGVEVPSGEYVEKFPNSVNVGNYEGTVSAATSGNFEGSCSTKYEIVQLWSTSMKKMKISGISNKKTSLKVKWKKLSKKQKKGVEYIEVQCCTNKNFTGDVITKKVKPSKKSVKIKGLRRHKKYYVRMRKRRDTTNIVYVSPWSKVKSKKTK